MLVVIKRRNYTYRNERLFKLVIQTSWKSWAGSVVTVKNIEIVFFVNKMIKLKTDALRQ